MTKFDVYGSIMIRENLEVDTSKENPERKAKELLKEETVEEIVSRMDITVYPQKE